MASDTQASDGRCDNLRWALMTSDISKYRLHQVHEGQGGRGGAGRARERETKERGNGSAMPADRLRAGHRLPKPRGVTSPLRLGQRTDTSSNNSGSTSSGEGVRVGNPVPVACALSYGHLAYPPTTHHENSGSIGRPNDLSTGTRAARFVSGLSNRRRRSWRSRRRSRI